jgi:hypothetical protein
MNALNLSIAVAEMNRAVRESAVIASAVPTGTDMKSVMARMEILAARAAKH